MKNTFVVYSPEDVTQEEFKEIFIKEYTWINALETPKDFFIFGTRGSGKSMLLNYLEFSHQLCYYNHDLMKFFHDPNRTNKYIGIMVHATDEQLAAHSERYKDLIENNFEEKPFVKTLCMHGLIMVFLYRILKTFTESKEMNKYVNSIDPAQVKKFCQKIWKSLDKRHVHKLDFELETKNTEMFDVLADRFIKERANLVYYINDKLQMKEITYDGNYSDFDFLLNFIIKIKDLLNLTGFSFYILIDNGDKIKKTMQLSIDSLIEKRKHKNVCFKVAIKKGTYWDYWGIEQPHDFSEIDIDELYSTQHTVYYSRIKEIANKRLELSGLNKDIESFLPESRTEKELLNKIKIELKEKYEQEYEESKDEFESKGLSKADYINNRISKYAQAELFRRLKKTPKSYAGFNSIVHLSSGIIRQFLDLCSNMIEEKIKRKGDENITEINIKTQNDVIQKYADNFMDHLETKYKRLEIEGNKKEMLLYKGLYDLIEALGKYYRARLMNPKLKEPRVFTFTLKDPNKDEEVERILQIGVNGEGLTGCFFQSYWYSSKNGLGKYKGYAFNRRLCPRYRIDHISFRGRIELSTDDLKFAVKNGKMPESKLHVEEMQPTLDFFTGGKKYE